MTRFRTSESLTEKQINSGLSLVVKDGLAAEAMATLTGGAFLIAMALHFGATNLQIGLLAALPTIANVFQLTSIWLVRKYKNRKLITLTCSVLARFPLLVIAILPFVFSAAFSLHVLIILLAFHYFFSSLVGTSWNSWMKDLVPADRLGSYFAHRTRLVQITSVTLSLFVAFLLDKVKAQFASYEYVAYSIMFICGGLLGLAGVYFLSKTPEPKPALTDEPILKLIGKPLRDINFRRFLIFNSIWAFAINLVNPFISVFLLKTIQLPFFYVIGLGVIGQLCSIYLLKFWGRFADRFSNKTIINICAPLYVLCLTGYTLTTIEGVHSLTILLLVIISAVSGIAIGGINFAINNISLKLAPNSEAIAYISARTMITSVFPAMAPIIGGFIADQLADHPLNWNINVTLFGSNFDLHLLTIYSWDFFFLLSALIAIAALFLLQRLSEQGEVRRKVWLPELTSSFKSWWIAKEKTAVLGLLFRTLRIVEVRKYFRVK
jgi:MFS family permease